MTTENKCFVFVHGALCGAWCWEQVVALLKAQGMAAHAIDLPGHGANTDVIPQSHREYVDAVISFVEKRDLRNVVLVGHSMGGSIIPYGAMALKGRVKRLVFYTTIFPEKGKTVLSVAPAFLEYMSKIFLFMTGYRALRFPALFLKFIFCNDMNRMQRQHVLSKIGPQPARPIVSDFPSVDISAFESLYITADQDRAITPRKQRDILSRIPNCRGGEHRYRSFRYDQPAGCAGRTLDGWINPNVNYVRIT